ncbi:hypothetical protein, partial [Rathayibacter tritici]|uniref:hypothetical protein n=1 Tax=Rathayibacter tritici TaxID=33888 RepID=UPI001CA4AB2E
LSDPERSRAGMDHREPRRVDNYSTGPGNVGQLNAADAQFEADDPANTAAPANFLEDGFELAKRVRSELSVEGIVTSYDPRAQRKVELIIDD